MKKQLALLISMILAFVNFTFAQDEPDYLCFEVEAGTTISLETTRTTWIYGNAEPKNPNLQYSFDKTTWTDYSSMLSIDKKSCIYFRGVNPNGFSPTDMFGPGNVSSSFKVSKEFKCRGNVMTLIDGTGKTKIIPNAGCFYGLFRNCPLTTAPTLPATTLKEGCYLSMFEGCTMLTTAPLLPATTLTSRCYEYMFNNCVSLTMAPELPATEMAESCYKCMFRGCAGLIIAPEWPAQKLANMCYHGMFMESENLITAPKLPSKDLVYMCYDQMFDYCTNLQKICVEFNS